MTLLKLAFICGLMYWVLSQTPWQDSYQLKAEDGEPVCAKVLLAAFSEVEPAGAAVGRIIARGIIPGGMEMMDNFAIRATDDFCQAGYPTEAAAILLCELDGTEAEVSALADQVQDI